MSNIYGQLKAKGMSGAALDAAKFADALYNGASEGDESTDAAVIPPLTYEMAVGHYIDDSIYSINDIMNIEEIYEKDTPLIIQGGYDGCGASDLLTRILTGMKTSKTKLEEFLKEKQRNILQVSKSIIDKYHYKIDKRQSRCCSF